MKLLVVAMVLSIPPILLSPGIGVAMPLEGRLSASTFPLPGFSFSGEAQLGWTGLPFRINIQGSYVAPRYPTYWLSAWGEYTHSIAPGSAIGLVAGINQSWTEGRMSLPGQPLFYQGNRWIVGVSFEQQWERFWLRATPNLVTDRSFELGSPSFNWMDTFFSGPAWLEIGYRITPALSVSLRSNRTPLTGALFF